MEYETLPIGREVIYLLASESAGNEHRSCLSIFVEEQASSLDVRIGGQSVVHASIGTDLLSALFAPSSSPAAQVASYGK